MPMTIERRPLFEKTLGHYDSRTQAVIEGIVNIAEKSSDFDDFIQKAKAQHHATYAKIDGDDTLQINGAFILFFNLDDKIIFNAISLGPVYSNRP